MSKKLTIGILFGGQSTEHEVSIRSATNIIKALDVEKYTPILIGITKQGTWLNQKDSQKLLEGKNISSTGSPFPNLGKTPLDVVFPVLHGSFGEDGSMQGFLRLCHIPFVGPSVLGSSVGMDKDITKRLLRDSGIDVAKSITVTFSDMKPVSFTAVKKTLGLPVFVKPANAGSSVGVSKVTSSTEFTKALETAFSFDSKVLIEECVVGRELEVSVLGNENPETSVVGEILPGADFYSYSEKYSDSSHTKTAIPALIPASMQKKIQAVAKKAYRILNLEGMSRVDFFLTKQGRIVLNEVNTIPGFTSISMYPQLWEASGLSYSALLDKLILLAIERYERETSLTSTL